MKNNVMFQVCVSGFSLGTFLRSKDKHFRLIGDTILSLGMSVNSVSLSQGQEAVNI